jgi:hypothetical protein
MVVCPIGSSTMRGSMNKLVFIKSKVSEGWCIAINPSDLISIMFYSRFNLWTNQQFYDAPVATYTGLLLLHIFEIRPFLGYSQIKYIDHV